MEEPARHLPVFLVLLVAVFASAFGAANLRAGDGFNVTFVPSSAGLRQSVVTVGGPGEAPSLPTAVRPAPVPDDSLERAVRDALGDDAASYGVVVRRLRDGRTFELNPNREFYAASTFKLAVLYEAERRISLGELRMDDRVTISGEDASEDLGTLGRLDLAPDGSLSVGEALRAMVTRSDNATAVALLHLLGAPAIDATLRRLGATGISVNTRDLPITAAGMARLMEALVRGEGLTPDARRHARELLLAQEWRDGIPAGLPPGASAGNKTGTWEGITHDIGFVEAPGGTYVIAVLSSRGWVWEPIARVSSAAWNDLIRDP